MLEKQESSSVIKSQYNTQKDRGIKKCADKDNEKCGIVFWNRENVLHRIIVV